MRETGGESPRGDWQSEIKIAEPNLVLSDTTFNDVSTIKHGFAPKAPNDTTQFLRGDATWAVPSGIPTGALLAYGGSSAPSGYVLCDGSAISRTTYAALFAVIGTAFGAGDGSTTFNVPDLKGRVPVGKGAHADVNALGNSDGLTDASRTAKHTHAQNTAGANTVGSDIGVKVKASASSGAQMETDIGGAVTHQGMKSGVQASGDSGWLVVNYIIKT